MKTNNVGNEGEGAKEPRGAHLRLEWLVRNVEGGPQGHGVGGSKLQRG